MRQSLILVLCIVVAPLCADVVDPDSDPAPVLTDLVEPLGTAEVDVLYDHDSERGRLGPSYGDRPWVAPLLGYQSWMAAEVDMDRYADWLESLEDGARGALAAVATTTEERRPALDLFEQIWSQADPAERVFITFAADDLEAAERIAKALESAGYAVYLAIAAPQQERLDPERLGQLFVQADHHFVVDTVAARKSGVIKFEAELLAELQRQQTWLGSEEKGLPPLKRGPMDVVEALGVLPMQVVPGGIVLGMSPTLEAGLKNGTLAINGSDYCLRAGDVDFVLEHVSVQTSDAIREFVAIEDSHSVVDIAGDEVTLADPFRGTRIGRRMIEADNQPFKHLSIKGAQKSLIVDQGVRFRRKGDAGIAADVTLEVRFYRRDEDGHANRIATLRFTVEDATGSARLLELAWSREPNSAVSFDGDGADHLVGRLQSCALDAALVSLARLAPATAE